MSRLPGFRFSIVLALVTAGALIGEGAHSAFAQVTAVAANAYGVSANVSLFGTAQPPVAPEPSVTLPSGGSATPVTATAPSETIKFGPATLFTSGPENVSTQGTPGATGSATSSSTVQAISAGPFTADSAASTCTANGTGTTASTAIANGLLVTSNDANGNPVTTVPIPASPSINDTIPGTLNNVGDSFKVVFNEQTTNPDGSVTVTAAHEYLLGPTAKGDLIIGQSVCGVTAVATTTTTAVSGTTTTTAPGATTTTAAVATTTTSTTGPTTTTSTTTTAPTTTTTLPSHVGGSAYGYYSIVSIFNSAPGTHGPAPSVALPPGGSATPVTASAASGDASYGPAQVFSSGLLRVSTQGTSAGGSVTSSTHVENVGPSTFIADLVTSTCTANATGRSASTAITNGKLVTSTDANGNALTTVPIPPNPPVNATYTGTVNSVGDSFKFVFNEQVVSGNGAITVNAGHEYLLGPTATGDVIFGHSVCVWEASSSPAGATSNTLAATGNGVGLLLALALGLLATGWTAARWDGGRSERGLGGG